jgi:glyoxylase-like metal-dependent hydrolase (beta-lactamase superfamily II)
MGKKVIPLNSGFSHSFIINDRKKILVDTGMNINFPVIMQQFKEVNVDPEDISLIIITHGHSDHFAHIFEYKKLTNAKIVCTKATADALNTGISSPVMAKTLFGNIFKKVFSGKLNNYKPVQAEIIIDKDTDLNNYGVSGKLLLTPGHTDCSLSIVLDTGEAIIGDILSRSFISSQKPVFSIFVKSSDEMRDSLKKLLNHNASVFYCGHGGPFDKDAVLKLLNRQ